ncbi:MAG: hypothetical protein LBT74_12360 [Acidobacteriota bacterium]|nr:hypothetical protein [Acidobacteriota bacterium]
MRCVLGNNVYAVKHGYEEYTAEDVADKQTGEVLPDVVKKRRVNTEKAETDALCDGFFISPCSVLVLVPVR